MKEASPSVVIEAVLVITELRVFCLGVGVPLFTFTYSVRSSFGNPAKTKLAVPVPVIPDGVATAPLLRVIKI